MRSLWEQYLSVLHRAQVKSTHCSRPKSHVPGCHTQWFAHYCCRPSSPTVNLEMILRVHTQTHTDPTTEI
ncbi:unnamed protein product [Prunus armeniaca]